MAAKYKCIIADDEVPSHQIIQEYISRIPDVEIAAQAYEGNTTLKLIREMEFHILFLDINMPGLTGIDIMRQANIRPATIAISASSDFAFESFQTNCVDYLLKPINFDRFETAVQKARLFFNTSFTLPKHEFLNIRINNKDIKVQTSNILYIQGLGNYIKLFLHRSKFPLVAYYSINTMQELLKINGFLKVHKSFLINMNFFSKRDKESIYLVDGTRIKIGKKFDYLVNQFLS